VPEVPSFKLSMEASSSTKKSSEKDSPTIHPEIPPRILRQRSGLPPLPRDSMLPPSRLPPPYDKYSIRSPQYQSTDSLLNESSGRSDSEASAIWQEAATQLIDESQTSVGRKGEAVELYQKGKEPQHDDDDYRENLKAVLMGQLALHKAVRELEERTRSVQDCAASLNSTQESIVGIIQSILRKEELIFTHVVQFEETCTFNLQHTNRSLTDIRDTLFDQFNRLEKRRGAAWNQTYHQVNDMKDQMLDKFSQLELRIDTLPYVLFGNEQVVKYRRLPSQDADNGLGKATEEISPHDSESGEEIQPHFDQSSDAYRSTGHSFLKR
jgi:hypothetical protein